jgi:hypothetical protein
VIERISRRGFLAEAGVGAAAAASMSLVSGEAAAAILGFGRPIFFYFYAFSGAAPTADGVTHAVAMGGSGQITHNHVVAAGSYTHFDLEAPVPKPVLSSGTWRATRLVSLHLIGTWGELAAGEVDLEIELHDVVPDKTLWAASLEIVSNIGSADLFVPGKDVGFTLTIPTAGYGPFSSFGAFPLAEGLTVFSLGSGS